MYNNYNMCLSRVTRIVPHWGAYSVPPDPLLVQRWLAAPPYLRISPRSRSFRPRASVHRVSFHTARPPPNHRLKRCVCSSRTRTRRSSSSAKSVMMEMARTWRCAGRDASISRTSASAASTPAASWTPPAADDPSRAAATRCMTCRWHRMP